MKTVNGNNKLERQINKAKKYLNLTLKEDTNKYLKVDINSIDNDVFIWFGEPKTTKYESLMIKPLNGNEKVFFKKEWATIKQTNYYLGSFVIFKSFGENEYNELCEIAKGCDDLWNLKEFAKTKNIAIEKN